MYAYGLKGAPAVGGGLPGLPRREAGSLFQSGESRTSRLTIDSFSGVGSVEGSNQEGVLIKPAGALSMRVAVIGAGAGGLSNGGGGGGACCATKIVPASDIRFRLGEGGGAGSNGENSVASFRGYLMHAGGGMGVLDSGVMSGGEAEGGDYNYRGGNGAANGIGGGAAGPNGRGGDASSSTSIRVHAVAGEYTGVGWGAGGGTSGSGAGVDSGTLTARSGGAGAGANSGPAVATATNVGYLSSYGSLWGNSSESVNTSSSGRNAGGGEMGGGGSYMSGSSAVVIGGSGGLVVEWFF